MRPVSRFAPLAALSLAAAVATAAGPAATVSPGEPDRAVEVATPCPTFSWAAAEGAASYELAVLDLAKPAEPGVVLRHVVAGAGFSWTPGRAECLAPGAYAWTVRALDAAGQALGGDLAWAAPRRFAVPALPADAELAAALEVLRRWQAGRASGAGTQGAPSGEDRGPTGKAVEASGAAAIRGENPASSGTSHGVWAQTGSPEGAGIVAVNLDGGPDLLLDGAAAGGTDTVLTEKALDRPAATPQSFVIENSLGAGMTLYVDSTAVSLVGHVHSGAEITSGTVADARIASTLARDSEVMPIVLAADGPGSNLDADLLDNLQGTSYQRRVSGTCGPGQAIQEVNADGTVACYDLPVPPHVAVVDDPADVVGEHPSLAIGTDGLPVIAYYNVTDGALVIAKCLDSFCDAARVTSYDPTNDIGQHASLAIGSDGYPVVAYYDATATALGVLKCSNALCSSGVRNTVDDTGAVGEYCSLAIGGDGLPVIAYYDATTHTLKVAKCNDAGCAGSDETISTVDTTFNAGLFASLAIGSDGLPVISYFVPSSLKVAKCDDSACTGTGETLTVVDSSGQPGYDTSIAIGTDGFPVIAHHGWSLYVLKITKCDDLACAGGGETNTVVDDSAGILGRYPSIAVAPDGNPIVSYADLNYAALKVVKCDDPACAAGGESFTYLDNLSEGSSWVHSAIAIGADGLPVIAYSILNEDSLKVAKCHNASCQF